MALLSIGNLWADTKTEGFETKATSTTYNGTVTVSSAESDCGIGWTIYYGTVSTNDKISGSKSAQMRYYSTSDNRGYVQSTTAIDGLSHVAFKARVSSTDIQMTVSYSADASSWTALATNETFSATGTGVDFEYDVPSGGKYIKIEIGDGSTKPSSGNIKFIVDDVVFTYTTGSGTPTCATPTFSPAAGSYEGTQNVTINSTTGATIYYTTDGTDPKTSGTKQTYASAIPVAADMTIKAYATLTSYDDSEVATAAYTITEGPDVVLDLTDNTEWGFPAGSGNKTVDEGSYSDGTYTIKVAGSTGQGYYHNTGYLLLGKTGAYIELPEFASPIEKIITVGTSGGSTGVTFNVFDGSTAVSTEATGCKDVDQTFNIENPEANKVYTIKVTGNANLQVAKIKIYFGAAAAVAKPTISGDENFVTSTTVTLGCTTSGASIYYTTDNSTPSSSNGTLYDDPFTLTSSATVKAIAILGTDESAVAEKAFTKVEALTTMAAVQAEAAADEKAINVVISNWVVTAVSGIQVWFADADNTKGILLYKSGHGFEAGKKLNGTVVGTKIKLYNLYPELTSLVASEVTVTDAEAISPRTTTIAALTSGHPAEQGTVVKLEDVTYSSSDAALSDGVNTIAADNKFFSSLALVDGTTYDITGVVTYYKNGDDAVVKIAPRAATDVEAKSAVVIPTAANLAALKAAARGTYILTLTNAVVTYVNGNNAFIEDATGGALIYFASHGYSAGDCLNGDYQVTTTDYQGKFEITAMEPQAGAATTTAEIPLTTVSIATLNANFASYESRRVKIVGANVTDAISGSDRNGAINDGAALAVYAAAGTSTITLTVNDNVDIIGYPGFHNTDQQLNVWTQADITVNEKEDPELAYDPVSETIEQGASWSAPTLTNPHSVTISSYASDNESVATVTDEGVIALAGGLGTAVITAHFNGDATYNAGNAIYTITVEEADARNKATGSAFEAISGNLTPAHITFAAYKGDGTTTPVINSSNIRLYKPASGKSTGSYLTVKAKVGCTIDQVKITFASAATAAYSVDDAALPTEAFITGQTELLTAASLNAQSVSIVNLKNGSIDVSEIKVWYTGSPLAIDHYFLGGTYETTFEQNGTFDYTGLELYAAYDAGETITEEITDFTVVADLSTAGAATASVQVNSVEVKTYEITVTAGKEDPALAYTPNTLTIAAEDIASWTAPVLSNTLGVTPIVYGSNNEAVATVTSEGVIALAGGYGTAIITAHFDETAAYVESEATYTITVNKPAATPTGTTYTKVTATADITDGEYLIVYEGDATHDAAVFDGSLDNANIDVALKALDVEIVSDEIAGNTDLDAAVFTIDVTAGSLKSASGLYIGKADYANGMDKSTTEAYVNTFAITDGAAVITAAGNCTLRYNYASDQLRFRYYKSGQQAIQLYKKVAAPAPKYSVTYAANGGTGDAPAAVEYEEGETFAVAAADLFTAPAGKEFDKWNDGTNDYAPGATYTVGTADVVLTAQWKDAAPAPVYTDVRTSLTPGNYYTICLKKQMTAVLGATLWKFVGKDASMAYIEQVNAPFEAGMPYIVCATDATMQAVLEGDDAGSAGSYNGLYGTFDQLEQSDFDNIATTKGENVYFIYENELRQVNGQSGNWIRAYRAYVIVAEITGGKPSAAPGRNVRSMPMHKDTATGMDELNASKNPVKMIIDGKLYILRGEKMYNANGQLVK